MRALPIFTAAVVLATPLTAAPITGQPARDFKLRDVDGNIVSLSDYKGKTVVLEWHNPGCPFVKKHYESGNMQKTQALAVGQGAVWLTVNSSAAGQQGNMTGAQAKQLYASQRLRSTEYLLDPSGVVGKAYAAKTTPHLYIVGPNGRLAYQGGIDDKPTSDKADIATARNHVIAALTELKAGKPVSIAETRPYGCGVKYAS